VQKIIIGDENPIECRPADLLEPVMDKARQEIGDMAQGEEDVISYALFPQVARPFLERRAQGSGGKEAVVAAIAAMIVQQAPGLRGPVEQPVAELSAWKLAWRPQTARWTGLL
jgi:oxaloacetate decarboxylase alpha subunit